MFSAFVFLTFISSLFLNNSCNGLQVLPENGTYNQWFNSAVNNTVEYILVFKFDRTIDFTSRVFIKSEHATIDAPLMVVVRQQKEVLSWQLPLVVRSEAGKYEFNQTSRILCPSNSINFTSSLQKVSDDETNLEDPIISISSASNKNVTFSIIVENDIDIFINLSTWYNFTVSPSEPSYYFYDFTEQNKNKDKNFDTLLLEVQSIDSVCMTVSIQNASCPVFDLNQDITFQGLWETVITKGGITIPKYRFPYGFFIVFSAKADDKDCVGAAGISTPDRLKEVRFILKPSISYNDYVIAVIITLGCIVLAYVILILTFWLLSKKLYKLPGITYFDDCDSQSVQDVVTPTNCEARDFGDSTSIDETEYDTIAEVDYDRSIILGKPILYLCDLARKDPRVLKKKSYFYLWHVLTVAVFYGLPVIELVLYYQNVLNESGNQDLCYYNFLCAHPLGFVSDFNHVFSNIGYVMFGLLYVFLVHKRAKLHNDNIYDRHFGIPQHYGLYYALGVALIMEGVLSGSYHICPNHSNFQFDSSFMYVMAVLCMVKLYQTRHPDINASAYATFGVLAVAILLGIIGILEPSLTFYIVFTVMHIVVCFLLTAQVYYFGNWKLDTGICKRVYRSFVYDFHASSWGALKPVHKGRMALLVTGNLCNWALAVFGTYHHDRDFATHLLAVFMSNTMLYFIFYIIMKLLHKERINLQALMYLVLSIMSACSAIYFFYHKSISWALTPAQSREYNQQCKLFYFYDNHDIWHFLSAIGMFFTFMVLLTLDDDLSHVLRSKICVF